VLGTFTGVACFTVDGEEVQYMIICKEWVTKWESTISAYPRSIQATEVHSGRSDICYFLQVLPKQSSYRKFGWRKV